MAQTCFLILAGAAAFGQTRPADLMRSAIEKQRAATSVQRESVRRQAASAATWLQPWNPSPLAPAPEAACDPLPESVVAPIVERSAKTEQLDAKLIRAVIEQESGYRPCAVSTKGAEGLMQLMPATAEELRVRDAFDISENIEAGSKYLKQLLGRYGGDVERALAAYNAGSAAIDQAGGIPDIPETRDYVDAILMKLGLTRTDQPNTPKPKPTGN